MNYLNTIKHWFQHLQTRSKLSLIAAIALILGTTIALCWWILTPTYAVLFHQLDEQDAHKILSQLEEDNITYQLRHGGQDILIDKNLVPKTRLKVMASGMQLTGNVGFELFDKNDFGMTDFSQKINYQRALQGELERTISGFDEIRQARVHLVIPENHLFNQEENQPKAAVTLQLKRALTPRQVQSIQQLIAASVAHLNLKNVVIVDQNGNTLSQTEEDNAYSHFTAKKTVEHYLNDKVLQILQKIFGKNQVLVKVNAEINYDELQRELITPKAKGQITHEKETHHSTLDEKGKTKGAQDVTREKTYEFGSEKELFKRASGTIEHLSVSVILPAHTDPKTIIKVQRLIESSVGLNKKRGDIISVEALIRKPAPAVLPAITITTPKAHEPYLMQWDEEKKWQLGLLLTVLILSGSTALFVMRRLKQKRRQQLLLELTQWLSHHES